MIVVINGYPLSGKDEFVKLFGEISHLPTLNVSSVDKVKEIAEEFGWNGKKDKAGRKFLSDLKKAYVEYCDGPNKYVIEKDSYDKVIFYHCREPEEIEKLVSTYKNVTTVLIRRFNNTEFKNDSDTHVEEYPYEYIIENNADLELLKKSVKTFYELWKENI
jgi:hypothetical protein